MDIDVNLNLNAHMDVDLDDVVGARIQTRRRPATMDGRFACSMHSL